jgi:hypothetical protein
MADKTECHWAVLKHAVLNRCVPNRCVLKRCVLHRCMLNRPERHRHTPMQHAVGGRRRILQAALQTALLAGHALPRLAHAASGDGGNATNAMSLGWYDGDRWRSLTLVPQRVVDFTPRPGDRVPIIEIGTPDALRSPVLRDESGRLRALPGGLLVQLRSPLPTEQARALLKAADLQPTRAVSDTLWLVDSPLGLASLHLANRLHRSGKFASVQPNWWLERRSR